MLHSLLLLTECCYNRKGQLAITLFTYIPPVTYLLGKAGIWMNLRSGEEGITATNHIGGGLGLHHPEPACITHSYYRSDPSFSLSM